MACIPAPACQAALNEATQRWPSRNRASDGICPSPEHLARNPTSDHTYGNAFDVTHDPGHGVDCNVLALQVISDERVKYVIWNRRIFNRDLGGGWRAYDGSNPHDHHMHVSIHADARKDVSAWWTDEEVDLKDDERIWLRAIFDQIDPKRRGSLAWRMARVEQAAYVPLEEVKADGWSDADARPRHVLARLHRKVIGKK